MRKFRPKSIFDITLVTACIRPSGASYRNELLARRIHHNASPQIDKLLAENYGYLVYQEDVIRFLMEVCGLSGGEADTVRRGIAKKKIAILESSMPKILHGYCSNSEKSHEEAEAEAKEFLQVIEDASSYMFNKSHAIAYSLLSYLCAYYRYYYPHAFLTAFLNCAANDDDIRSGTEHARQVGIRITSPKWGVSRKEYSFDVDKNIIAKGLASVKYMGPKISDELYELSKQKTYRRYMELLTDIFARTSVDTRQIDILIKLDFFSEFGNQRELLRLTDLFIEFFKKGDVKMVRRDGIDGTWLGEIVARHSTSTTKNGSEAKSYTIQDLSSILFECEDYIKAAKLEDLPLKTKIQNTVEYLGYLGYQSGREEDRPLLYVREVFPLKRRSDGKQFGYSVSTKSIGSGIETKFTVRNSVFDKEPIRTDDIIYCKKWMRDQRGYFNLLDYEHRIM